MNWQKVFESIYHKSIEPQQIVTQFL